MSMCTVDCMWCILTLPQPLHTHQPMCVYCMICHSLSFYIIIINKMIPSPATQLISTYQYNSTAWWTNTFYALGILNTYSCYGMYLLILNNKFAVVSLKFCLLLRYALLWYIVLLITLNLLHKQEILQGGNVKVQKYMMRQRYPYVFIMHILTYRQFSITHLTAKLFNLNFHPLEIVSRWRDPQLQVRENYSDLTKWRSTVFKYCWLMSHFIFNMFKRWYLMCQ